MHNIIKLARLARWHKLKLAAETPTDYVKANLAAQKSVAMDRAAAAARKPVATVATK